MKVKCIDTEAPRSDGHDGKPSALTVGIIYVVAEVLDTKFPIINDAMKIGRYSQARFEVVDSTEVPPLRDNFNTLTTPLRSRIKELEKQLAEE